MLTAARTIKPPPFPPNLHTCTSHIHTTHIYTPPPSTSRPSCPTHIHAHHTHMFTHTPHPGSITFSLKNVLDMSRSLAEALQQQMANLNKRHVQSLDGLSDLQEDSEARAERKQTQYSYSGVSGSSDEECGPFDPDRYAFSRPTSSQREGGGGSAGSRVRSGDRGGGDATADAVL